MRYRFYREHKFVSYILSELERMIAKTDFHVDQHVKSVREQLKALQEMMVGHAAYEERALHQLLAARGSTLHLQLEAEHAQYETKFAELEAMLDRIATYSTVREKIEEGYKFFLAYRLFVCENLKHFHDEETLLMPALHALYSDEELRQVEFTTYGHMTPEQMVHMMEVLFPHMNTHDREVFLRDIKDAEPDKFVKAWEEIAGQLDANEKEAFKKKLG